MPEARALLATGEVERASLDHDLGDSFLLADGTRHYPYGRPPDDEINGRQLVRWMAATGHWPRIKPTVHSQNKPCGDEMKAMIDDWWPGVHPEAHLTHEQWAEEWAANAELLPRSRP